MAMLIWTYVSSTLVIMNSAIVTGAHHKLACFAENFEASCPDNQILLISKASYGRMEINRCAKENFGYIGCTNDVTLLLDRKCSGRHACQFLVTDDVFPVKKCHDEIKSHLNVTYECLTVQSPDTSKCENTGAIQVTSKQGYLSNMVSDVTSCGSVTSPWTISGLPGQYITLSLYDFTLYNRRSRPDPGGRGYTTTVCHAFATVEEPGIRESICDQRERYQPVYKSKGHELQVAFEDQDEGEQNYVLIHYAIKGCPDLPTPVDGWVKRAGQTVSLGCNHEDVQWSLHCENGSHWIGHTLNCTTESGAHTSTTGGYFGHMSLSLGVVIVIVLGLAIAIGLLVLAAGLILMKRRNREQERQEAMMLYGTKTPSSEIYGKHRPWVYERTNSQCSSQCMVHGGTREYEYGTVVYGHRDYIQSPDVVQSSNNDLTQEQQQDLALYSQSRNKQPKPVHSSLGSLSGGSSIPRQTAPIQAKLQTSITVGGHGDKGEGRALPPQTTCLDNANKAEESCDMCTGGTQRHHADTSCTMHTFKPALPQL